MRPILVVMASPRLDDCSDLDPVPEPFHAEALVAELPVQALGSTILPWLSGIDQRGLDARLLQPLQDGMADELGAIVRSQVAHFKSRC